jgi:hypothetical protein
MRYFARIEDSVVVDLIQLNDDDAPTEHDGQSFISSLNISGMWLETFHDNSQRGKYAGIGDTYDAVNDVFVSPTSEVAE